MTQNMTKDPTQNGTRSTTLLLIRHGQTDWNEGGRWQGTTDTHLSALGHAQGEQLAYYLARGELADVPLPITAIYSSDLMRAAHTANYLAERLNLPVAEDARWRELNMGLFQGLTYTEINHQFPDEVRQMETGDLDFLFPKGETRRAMQERTYAALLEIAAAHTGETVAIFTHGGTIRLLLRRITGDDPIVGGHRIHNTSITVLEHLPGEENFRVASWPHTPHLVANERSGEL